MKRVILAAIAASAVFANTAQALNCTPDNQILETQAEVNALGATGCDTVVGRLVVRDGADIVDLTPLADITSVGGSLQVLNLPNLDSLEGMENISGEVDRLVISNVSLLNSLEQLSGITGSDGDLLIEDNPVLWSLQGLKGITSVGRDLTILNNDSLSIFLGLEALTFVGRDINIRNNEDLIIIAGLHNVTGSIRNLVVRNNPALAKLYALRGITEVTNDLEIRSNDTLRYLAGLASITSVGNNIIVQGNDELISAEHLQSIASVGNRFRMTGNENLSQCGNLGDLIATAAIVNINSNGADCNSEGDQEAIQSLDYAIANNDWTTASNWDPAASPSAERDALIRNDGTATESGATISAANLVIGDTRTDGSGELNVSAQSVSVPGHVRIGAQPGGYNAAPSLATNGSLVIDGAPSVSMGGDTFAAVVGAPTVQGKSLGTVDANLTITDTDSINIYRLHNGGMLTNFQWYDFPETDVPDFDTWGDLFGGDYADSQLVSNSATIIDGATNAVFGDELFSGYIGMGGSLPTAELTSSSNLSIQNVTGTTEFEDDFIIGLTTGGIEYGAAFAGTATSDASLLLNEMGTVIVGEDLTTGKNEDGWNVSGTLTTRGTSIVSNIQTLDIDSDLKSSRAASLHGDFSGEVNVFGDVTVSDVTTVLIGSDLEVSRLSGSAYDDDQLTGTVNSTGVAVLTDVTTVEISDDIEVGKVLGTGDGSPELLSEAVLNSTGTLTFRNIPNLSIGADSSSSEADIGVIALIEAEDGSHRPTANAQGTVVMANVTAEVGGIVRVGVIDIDSSYNSESDTPTTASSSSAFGTLALQSSSLVSPTIEVGVVAENHEGSATGSLELNPSFIDAENLIIGDGGRIVLNVNGPNRASMDNLGSAGLYSAVDATNVVLNGEVVVRVNFRPAPGTSHDIQFLDGETITLGPDASVRIEGLPAGVSITDPVVAAAGGRSNYRATVSAAPVAEVPALNPGYLALMILILGALGGRRKRS